jgi:hypothetical protein
MQAFAKPAYLIRFLFCALLSVAGCCPPGSVRVVSSGVAFQRERLDHVALARSGKLTLTHMPPRRLARKALKFEDQRGVEKRRQEVDQHDLGVELHLGQPGNKKEGRASIASALVRTGT